MPQKEHNYLYPSLAAVSLILILALAVFLKQTPALSKKHYMESAVAAYAAGDYKEAIQYFAQGEVANNPEAAFALGAMHFSGKGTPVNRTKAISFYEKAALFNYPPAQLTLAILYAEGQGVPKDAGKAVEYAKKAADNGDEEARMMLAGWYENGTFTEKNVPKAVELYKAAAKQGDINAKTALYIIYKNGADGVPANLHTAMRWNDSIEKQKKLENRLQATAPEK